MTPVLLLLFGCAAAPAPHTVTLAICTPPVPFKRSYWADGTDLDPACRDALLADVGADVESFAAGDGMSALDQLVEGLYALLGRDAGPLADDEWGDATAGATRELLLAQDAGATGEAGPAAYSLVAGIVQATVFGVPEGTDENAIMAFDWSEGTLTVSLDGIGNGLETAARLVHEAGHGITREGHVACDATAPDDDVRCDPDWNRSLGFEATLATAWGRHDADWEYEANRVAGSAASLILENSVE